MDDEQVRARVAELESLLESVDDTSARAIAGLLELYGEALRRIVAAVREAPEIAAALNADELVSHLLLLHELDAGAREPTFISLL